MEREYTPEEMKTLFMPSEEALLEQKLKEEAALEAAQNSIDAGPHKTILSAE